MSATVVVFGRLPSPGRVKTRLAESLGDEAAAAVYRVLLEHTLEEAAASGLPVELAVAEPVGDEDPLVLPAGVRVALQSSGDLGTRMAARFAAHFAAAEDVVVLVGSDIPALTRELLREAAERCSAVPVVLAPAHDGGYALLAQRAPGVAMFDGVPWSSRHTLAATRARLTALEVAWHELPPLADVDTAADLARAVADPTRPRSLAVSLARAAPRVPRHEGG